MKYKILEHTADLKLKVFGRSKEELFENAMLGMFKGARYRGEGKRFKKKIRIESFNLSSLLVDFLNEILYLCETKKEVYEKVKFEKFSDNKLEGILTGKKLKEMGTHIKAVTYHGFDIQQRKDNLWEATILFDI